MGICTVTGGLFVRIVGSFVARQGDGCAAHVTRRHGGRVKEGENERQERKRDWKRGERREKRRREGEEKRERRNVPRKKEATRRCPPGKRKIENGNATRSIQSVPGMGNQGDRKGGR